MATAGRTRTSGFVKKTRSPSWPFDQSRSRWGKSAETMLDLLHKALDELPLAQARFGELFDVWRTRFPES